MDFIVYDTPEQARAAGYVSIERAIEIKPKDRSTYNRQANSGELPACQVRKKSRLVFYILESAISARGSSSGKKSTYSDLQHIFLSELTSGAFTGTPLSKKYVLGVIKWGLDRFWKLLAIPPGLEHLTAENFTKVVHHESLRVDDLKRRDFYSTRMAIYRAVTRFMDYLIKRGFKAPSDKTGFILPKRKFKPQKRMLEGDKIKEVIRFNQNWRQGRSSYDVELTDLLIHLYAYAGIRRIEAATIPKAEINFTKGLMLVYGKGGKERYVRLTLFPELIPKIKAWLKKHPNDSEVLILNEDGEELTEGAIKGRFLRLSDAINLEKAYEKLSETDAWETYDKAEKNRTASKLAERLKNIARPHDFRRSFATILAKRGMPMTLIQVLLGHNDLGVTQGYVLTDINSVMEWESGTGETSIEIGLSHDEVFDALAKILRG